MTPGPQTVLTSYALPFVCFTLCCSVTRDAAFFCGIHPGSKWVCHQLNAAKQADCGARCMLFMCTWPDRHGRFMQAAAVDPGGSYTSIYRQSRIFSRGPLNWIMRVLIDLRSP